MSGNLWKQDEWNRIPDDLPARKGFRRVVLWAGTDRKLFGYFLSFTMESHRCGSCGADKSVPTILFELADGRVETDYASIAQFIDEP